MHRAVFLDRDGTLNHDSGYIHRPEDLLLFPGVPEAIRLLNGAGYLAVVVTNQAGSARGYYTEEDLCAFHRRLREEVAAGGGRVDGVYHCPHHPTAGEGPLTRACFCRKPAPGMLYRAALDLEIDLGGSFLVGDREGDLEAGWRAGCRTALVLTGEGRTTQEKIERTGGMPHQVFETLLEAVRWIIRTASPERSGPATPPVSAPPPPLR